MWKFSTDRPKGDEVVVAANFLIDAESNLKAAVGGPAMPPGKAATPTDVPGQRPGHRAEARSTASMPRTARSCSWPGPQPEMAGDDDGVQGGQSCAVARLKPGSAIAFEFVERAARRMGGDEDHAAKRPARAPATSVRSLGKRKNMLNAIIDWSGRNRFLVLLATLFIVVAGIFAVLRTPIDALPDLSDVQVIVYTEYRGRRRRWSRTRSPIR